MREYLTLFDDCGPDTCSLLPVLAGKNFGQYYLRQDRPPVGYVEEHLYTAFRIWRESGRTIRTLQRLKSGLVVFDVDLDTSADAWLWNPPGHPDKSYSSRPAFTAWWRKVVGEWRGTRQSLRTNPRLL